MEGKEGGGVGCRITMWPADRGNPSFSKRRQTKAGVSDSLKSLAKIKTVTSVPVVQLVSE